jgi:hypothetical protein
VGTGVSSRETRRGSGGKGRERDSSFQARGGSTPRSCRRLVAHYHLGLANLYRRTGKHEQAHEHLTTATTMYREMGMTFWLEKAERVIRELG